MKSRSKLAWVGLLAIGIVGCSKDPAPPNPGKLSVPVASVRYEPVTEYAEYTGRLEPLEMVEIRPRVSGHIESIHFKEGNKVKKGDLLFVIDPRPFTAQVNRLKAVVSQAEATESLAQANLRRAESLIADKAISQEEADIRRSEALRASADLEAAEADLAIAELDLEFTRVASPIDGITDRHQVTVGNLVYGGQQNATLLTTVVPHSPIYAYYEVDERSFLRNVRRYFEGQAPGRGSESVIPAYLGLDDEDGFPHEGEVNFASNQLDPNTATITVRAVFENESEFLTPGLFARIRTPVSEGQESILIPDSAVGTNQTQRFVWVVLPDNSLEQRRIELGPKYEGLRIVREGLQPKERIAINGIMFLRPGMTVDPVEETY